MKQIHLSTLALTAIIVTSSVTLMACQPKTSTPNTTTTSAETTTVIEETTAPTTTAASTLISPLTIGDLSNQQTIKDGQQELLVFDIAFPQIMAAESQKSLIKINDFYKNAYQNMMDESLPSATTSAKEDLAFAKESKYDFNPHGFYHLYEVKHNADQKLSVFCTSSTYTGGAHPNAEVSAQTFDIVTGEKLTLGQLLGVDEDTALKHVYASVLSQMKSRSEKGESFYYEDFEKNYMGAFMPNDFYLKDGKVMVFYQSYAIAPYAEGIPEFEIPPLNP